MACGGGRESRQGVVFINVNESIRGVDAWVWIGLVFILGSRRSVFDVEHGVSWHYCNHYYNQ